MNLGTALIPAAVLLAGMGVALQALLLGGFRLREGVLMATRMSFVGTLAGAAVLLAVQPAAIGARLGLVAAAVLLTLTLLYIVRGPFIFFLPTGLFGFAYLLASAAGVATVGVGLTVALVVTGQMIASLTLDSFGWLGVRKRPLTQQRILGVTLLILGVVLIRLS